MDRWTLDFVLSTSFQLMEGVPRSEFKMIYDKGFLPLSTAQFWFNTHPSWCRNLNKSAVSFRNPPVGFLSFLEKCKNISGLVLKLLVWLNSATNVTWEKHISSIPIQTRPLHALLNFVGKHGGFVQVFFKSPPYDHSIGMKWKTLSRSCGKSVHHQLAIEWMKMAKPAKPRFGGRELVRLSAYHLMSEAPVGSARKSFKQKILGIKCLGVSKMWPLHPFLPKVLSEKHGPI